MDQMKGHITENGIIKTKIEAGIRVRIQDITIKEIIESTPFSVLVLKEAN